MRLRSTALLSRLVFVRLVALVFALFGAMGALGAMGAMGCGGGTHDVIGGGQLGDASAGDARAGDAEVGGDVSGDVSREVSTGDSGTDAYDSAVSLTTIVLTPSKATVVIGTTVTLTAEGTYTDGTKIDLTAAATWSIDAPAIASVGAGGASVVTAIAPGIAHVSATVGSSSGKATITVPKPPIRIDVTPPTASTFLGGSTVFAATATFADGSMMDVTSTCAWSVDDPAVATIAPCGGIIVVGTGTTTVRIKYAGVEGTATLTVGSPFVKSVSITPLGTSLCKCETVTLKATATYSDLTTKDVTSLATWSVTPAGIVTLVGSTVTPVASGTATVTATLGLVSGTTSVTVLSCDPTSIVMEPPTASTTVGGTAWFAVKTKTSCGWVDLTSVAAWSIDDASIASSSSGPFGGATGVAAGTTTVRAKWIGLNASASLTVAVKTLASIAVTPADPTAKVGAGTVFHATATYTDATTADVTLSATWSSSDTSVATMGTSGYGIGQATAVAVGTTTISAKFSGLTASTTLTVTP